MGPGTPPGGGAQAAPSCPLPCPGPTSTEALALTSNKRKDSPHGPWAQAALSPQVFPGALAEGVVRGEGTAKLCRLAGSLKYGVVVDWCPGKPAAASRPTVTSGSARAHLFLKGRGNSRIRPYVT